jgi:hypothetical protein
MGRRPWRVPVERKSKGWGAGPGGGRAGGGGGGGGGGGPGEKEASMLEKRNGFGACVVGGAPGQVWAVGGNKGFECLAATEYYDIESGRWVGGPRLGEARHWHAVAAVPSNGRMYALGGWAVETMPEWDGRRGLYENVTRENSRLLTHVESLDPREGTWQRESAMRQGRIFHAAAGAGCYLYAIGGCDYSGEALQSVEVMDVRVGRWHRAADLGLNRTYLSALTVSIRS